MRDSARFFPFAAWIEGQWQQGLEVEIWDGFLVSHRATSQSPDPLWLSPGFVNAHSHLEYRTLLGRLDGLDYWPWLRELTMLKAGQSDEDVRQACHLAATENYRAGVRLIAEHSDRPFAVRALQEVGIQGRVLQELITFDEAPDTEAKWKIVEERRAFQGAEAITPHATWSVDRTSLSRFSEQPFVSIHAAETSLEGDLFERHEGPIAALFQSRGKRLPLKQPIIDMLDEVGLLREGVQLVHAGGFAVSDYQRLAASGVMIAHCPRSNANLGCPLPDLRLMLDLGMTVGLGLDSAASSGPIDILAEMRAMMAHSAVSPDEAWHVATNPGAIGMATHVPWIGIESAATSAAEMMASPSRIVSLS